MFMNYDYNSTKKLVLSSKIYCRKKQQKYLYFATIYLGPVQKFKNISSLPKIQCDKEIIMPM